MRRGSCPSGFILEFKYKGADSELKNELIFCAWRADFGGRNGAVFEPKTWFSFGWTWDRQLAEPLRGMGSGVVSIFGQFAWLECGRCEQVAMCG